MSHLRSINPVITVLLLLAAGLSFAAFILAGITRESLVNGRRPQLNSTRAVAASPDRDSARLESPLELAATEKSEGSDSDEEFIGVTMARGTIEITASSEGRLETVDVNLGDRVKSGDRIARVNSDPIKQQLAMAQASWSAAEADERRTQLTLAEAEDRCSRRRSLAAEGLLSREEVVSAELQVKMSLTNVDAARARVAEQQARVAQIRDALSHTDLRAPFAGTVGARLAHPGSMVQPGTPVISLIREDQLWIRFAVPRARLSEVKVGTLLNVKVETLGGGLSATTGVTEHVAPAVDAVSQLSFVEARLKLSPEWRGRVVPGLTARCRIVR